MERNEPTNRDLWEARKGQHRRIYAAYWAVAGGIAVVVGFASAVGAGSLMWGVAAILTMLILSAFPFGLIWLFLVSTRVGAKAGDVARYTLAERRQFHLPAVLDELPGERGDDAPRFR